MRDFGLHFFLLVLLVCPAPASSRQDTEPKDTKNDGPSDTTSAPPKDVENWQMLSDIKSGLQPLPPFEVQVDTQPEFVRELVRVQWRPGDPIDLWVIRPTAPAKPPVVIYLYSYPGDPDQFRDNAWCKRVTAGGFAAVGFVSALTGQRYANRPMKKWFVSELEESLGSSVHDVQLILNYLADRGDLDLDRVGMFGMGSGASIAVLAAKADPRIKALDLLDPWGDWPDWLRESPSVPENERRNYTTAEFLKSVAPLDPIAYLPSLRTRALRLQQTLSQPDTPRSAKERIAASVSDPLQLVRYTNPEGLLKAWQISGLSGWIKRQLRPQTQRDYENPGRTERSSDSAQK
jgi:pimeloyl-ACP methyl ester carboxylesterase